MHDYAETNLMGHLRFKSLLLFVFFILFVSTGYFYVLALWSLAYENYPVCLKSDTEGEYWHFCILILSPSYTQLSLGALVKLSPFMLSTFIVLQLREIPYFQPYLFKTISLKNCKKKICSKRKIFNN